MGDNNIGWEGGIESFTRTKIKHNEEKQNVTLIAQMYVVQASLIARHNYKYFCYFVTIVTNMITLLIRLIMSATNDETTISHVTFLQGDCEHGKINKTSRSWV